MLRERAIVGQLETGEAANGLDISSGSNREIRRSQDVLNQYDTAALRHDTAQKIYGYQIAGVSSGAEAGLRRTQAADASTAGDIGAFSSLLSAAGQGASQYFNWMRVSGNSGAKSSGGGFQDTTSTFAGPSPQALFP